MKFATVTAVLLMIIVCVLLPKLPAIHTWAVEREEERIAEAELAEQKITMSDPTIKIQKWQMTQNRDNCV